MRRIRTHDNSADRLCDQSRVGTPNGGGINVNIPSLARLTSIYVQGPQVFNLLLLNH